MGSLLEREALDQIEGLNEHFSRYVYDLTQPLVFFPVRHHSPACAYHLLQTFAAYKPDIVLIEGPAGANDLLDIIASEQTKTPVAIYYTRRSDEDRVSCYYPFLSYSPEYVALREASQRGIAARFIDLDYGIRTNQSIDEDMEEEETISSPDDQEKSRKISLQDESLLASADFIRRLCEKTGDRSFDELWERLFETGGLSKSSATFVQEVFTYCTLARMGYSEQQLELSGDIERERYMAQEIRQAVQQHSRVLVITGGFHTWGLLEQLGLSVEVQKKPDSDMKDDNQLQMLDILRQRFKLALLEENKQIVGVDSQAELYPMVFTFAEADRLNGYASGMPYVSYYDAIWQAISKRGKEPYRNVSLQLLAELLQVLRKKKDAASVADAIEAQSLSDGLAVLRGKSAAGVYELIDSVQAAFIKGERTLATSAPLEELSKLLTGSRIGEVAPSTLEAPIVRDFKQQCKSLRIPIQDTTKRSRVLQLYARESHRQASRLFHTAVFLDLSFCKRVSGPDWLARSNVNLLRESWDYSYSSLVEARLIECAMYGGSMQEAAASKLEEQMARLPENQGSAAAKMLLQAAQMGLDKTAARLFVALDQVLDHDTSFVSLCETLQVLTLLKQQAVLLDFKKEAPLASLIDRAFDRAVDHIHLLDQCSEAEHAAVADHLRLLYLLAQQHERQYAADSLAEQLRELLEKPQIAPMLEGVAAAIEGQLAQETASSITKRAVSYIYGSEEKLLLTAQFLQGVFLVSRDIFLEKSGLLQALDMLLSRLTHEQFVQLTPELRLAFTSFTAGEIALIADKVAQYNGVSPAELEQAALNEAELLHARGLDAAIRREFERWQLI